MPRRSNLAKTNGGAPIENINDLHDKLVFAAHQALKNEVEAGEIKASTLNSVRQICADAGILPTRKASAAMQDIMVDLPVVDIQAVSEILKR